MKLRHAGLFLLTLLLLTSASVLGQVSEKEVGQIPLREVTLFSRIKYQNKPDGYEKAVFSFQHGVRGDVGLKATGNVYDILYGNISIDGDTDWFFVSRVGENRSRIKDLGELKWSEVFDVPVLHAAPEPHRGIRMWNKGQSSEETSNGQVSRVALGHIYVVHIKDNDSDFYAMFRVEELVPSDRCVISWKLVPSPER